MASKKKEAPKPVPFVAQFYQNERGWNCKIKVWGKLAGFATMPSVDDAFALAHRDADERGLLVEQPEA